VWKGNMACDRDGYGRAEYMSEENIEEVIWTSSRTREMANNN
jgi:nitrous oxidase accessory protein NosD